MNIHYETKQLTKTVQGSTKRNFAFDILRIFACIMVIINHTNSWIFFEYFPSVSGKISLLLFFLSKAAVPIFFMISGSLLLGKCDSYRVTYGKRALRIIIDIVIFSVLTALILKRDLSVFSWDFFRSLIKEPIRYSYWYLYSYLSLLLILPFLQRMVSVMSSKDFTVLLAIMFLINRVIPFLSTFGINSSISGHFTDNFFSGGIFYLLLGYYISVHLTKWINQIRKVKTGVIIACCVLIVAVLLLCFYITSMEYYNKGEFSLVLDNIHNLPITVYSAALFLLVLLIFQNVKVSEKISKLTVAVGEATFGVYLIHSVAIDVSRRILVSLCGRLNDLLAVLIMDFFIFVGCTILIILIRKIPGMKKIL